MDLNLHTYIGLQTTLNLGEYQWQRELKCSVSHAVWAWCWHLDTIFVTFIRSYVTLREWLRPRVRSVSSLNHSVIIVTWQVDSVYGDKPAISTSPETPQDDLFRQSIVAVVVTEFESKSNVFDVGGMAVPLSQWRAVYNRAPSSSGPRN